MSSTVSNPLPKQPTALKKVFVETLGCQMNANDSELMLGLLSLDGFEQTHIPAEADLIIINTCQIRENATDKAYGQANRFNRYKKLNPNVKIAMTGCTVQQDKDTAFERSPYIDIVVGTQNIKDLPQLVTQAFAVDQEEQKKQGPSFIAVDKQKDYNTYELFDEVVPVRQSKLSAFISIIEGCDYFCTYCVVPYTRGRQISRHPHSILKEAKQLAAQGYPEITLLGQTVDSYGKDFTEKTHQGVEHYRLNHLMADIATQVPEIKRIRFTTSHPLDLSDEVIDCIAQYPSIMPHIHIPMQAGNSEILERMRRGYTKEEYFALIDRIRAKVPHCAITGDFIVGFPGETEAQFQESIEAVIRCQLDMANTAVFSPRLQTPAGKWVERGDASVITHEEGKDRLERLNKTIEEVANAKNQHLVGQQVLVLVEGHSKRPAWKHRWASRTETNKLVHFEAPETLVAQHNGDLTGQFFTLTITEATAFSMLGQLV